MSHGEQGHRKVTKYLGRNHSSSVPMAKSDSRAPRREEQWFEGAAELSKIDHEDLKSHSLKSLLTPLKRPGKDLVLRFASGIRGYYVRYDTPDQQFRVCYSGPHGPETRWIDINERNIQELKTESEFIEYIFATTE